MMPDDDLLPDVDAAVGDLLQELALLGTGPAPRPNAALQLFLEEQQVAAIPLPREPAAVVLTPKGHRGRGAHRQLPLAPRLAWRIGRAAGRVAGLGLVMKLALGGGIALAGVTGAGLAGALPPALQDTWDDVVGSASPLDAPAADQPAKPDPAVEPPAAGSGSAPAPTAEPDASGSARLPAATDAQDVVGPGDQLGPPAAGASAASTSQAPAPAAPAAPPSTGGGGTAVPAAPIAPQPAYDPGPTTDSDLPAGEAWAPVSDEPTTEPTGESASPSTAPAWPGGGPTREPTTDQPLTAPSTDSGTTAGGDSTGGESGSW